jgi:4-aminobutyrate aminotransferase-like enzyme
MPLSACAAPAEVMDAWPLSDGEALHTSTFLGHPLSCAAGSAVLDLVASGLPDRARAVGDRLREGLESVLADVPGVVIRGLGLLLGVEVIDAGEGPRPGAGVRIGMELLSGGVLALPAGDRGSVIELSPPAVLTAEQIDHAVTVVAAAVRAEVT